MGPVEVITVDSTKIACDGVNYKSIENKQSNASKHPLVYLNMGKEDFIVCPYCSKYFTTKTLTNLHVGSHS
jgi:uncharacterized Zn-finger protein